MARVFVDVNVFGERWLESCIGELIASSNVKFSYANCEKFEQETESCLKALRFYKLVGEMGKREDAPRDEMEKRIEFLENKPEWQREGSCDDPHIFALVFLKPTPFILSMDKRMATCRGCMNALIDKKYCQFSLISNGEVYKKKRSEILS